MKLFISIYYPFVKSISCFSLDSARDDEHRLIARYAAKLAQENRSGMVSIWHTSSFFFDIFSMVYNFF